MSKKKNQQPDYTDLIIEHGIDPLTRTIDCSGEVDERMYRKILRGIRILTNHNSEPIILILNTLGGDLYSAFAIHDAISSSPSPVDIHTVGACMSAGLIILQAGRVRSAGPLSRFMVHTGSLATGGDVERVIEHIEADKEERKLMRNIIERRVTKKFRWPKGDKYFFADEALELGIIDEIK